jgi:hypothetical protein
MNAIETYRCATCGKSHADVPLSFAANFPDIDANMTNDERDARATIGSDQCIIDQKWFLSGDASRFRLSGVKSRSCGAYERRFAKKCLTKSPIAGNSKDERTCVALLREGWAIL